MYSLPSNPLSALNVGNEGSGHFSAESLDPIYRSAVIIDDFIIITRYTHAQMRPRAETRGGGNYTHYSMCEDR